MAASFINLRRAGAFGRLVASCHFLAVAEVILAAIVAADSAIGRHGLLGGGHDSSEGVRFELLPVRPDGWKEKLLLPPMLIGP